MATSKTLTPTNVTIQIPAFTDKPDQRVNSNCIDKEADAINALSDQIATSQWVNTSLSGVLCRKKGTLVQIMLNVAFSLTTTFQDVATLPSGYYPDMVIYTTCVGSNGVGIVIVCVTTQGVIQARVDSGTGSAINGLITY